jgi:ADP-ribose pyrophosphatase YjhB (NUDIX family)
MKLDYEHSAGVIPARYGPELGMSYLVIHSARVYNPRARWEFPKGRIEPREAADRAAAREFQEETGITSWAFREGFERDISYMYIRNGRKRLKTVTYFVAEVFDDSTMAQSDEHMMILAGVGIVGARSTRFRSRSVTRRLDVSSLRLTPGFAVTLWIVLGRIVITARMRM